MTRKSILALAGVLIVALIFAAVGGVIVRAQTATPPTTQAPAAPQGTPQAPRTNLGQDFWQALANRLGISTDTLQSAVKNAAKDTIDKAVQAGRLTQSQADQAKQRVDQWQGNGIPFGFFGRRGFGGPGMFGRGGFGAMGQIKQDMFNAAATTLNMTTQDLMTQLRSGKTLAAIAQAQNVDQTTLKNAMVSAGKADVDKAVSSGQLTQQQGDQIKSQLDQLDLNSFMGHAWGMGRGKWFGAPNQSPQPQATPTSPSA